MTQTTSNRNFASRTLWTADNLDVMRGMNSKTVDMIYLDPPFNSNRDYASTIAVTDTGGRQHTAQAAFKDTWTLDDIKQEWAEELEVVDPALWHAIVGAGYTAGDSMQAYLTYMAVRLLEMRRILSDTGSIYLHCDDVAVHYLKQVMDSIFGTGGYRNDIIWRRATAHNDAKRYGRIVDHVLFYTRSASDWFWDGATAVSQQSEDRKRYPRDDNDGRGRYRTGDLTGAGTRGGESVEPWNGYDVAARGRHWAAPLTGAYAEWIEGNVIPGYLEIGGIHARLDALDTAGMIYHPKKGRSGWPGLKRYASADNGSSPQSLILHPIGFTNYSRSRERTGYATQKPIALVKQFVQASCPPNGMVFDPFCGCATTLIAAEVTGRQWVGCDIEPLASDLVVTQLQNRLTTGHCSKPARRNRGCQRCTIRPSHRPVLNRMTQPVQRISKKSCTTGRKDAVPDRAMRAGAESWTLTC